jgi:hypothetical protein
MCLLPFPEPPLNNLELPKVWNLNSSGLSVQDIGGGIPVVEGLGG